MATVTVINQPLDGQLGDILISSFEKDGYEEFDAIVAFAKNSGVLRLKKPLERFRSRGSRVKVYVGIDLDGTSYEALTSLLALTDDLYVIHTESSQTFHPKVYRFIGKQDSRLIIGSNNMTAGGLWTNFETSTVLNLVEGSKDDEELRSSVSTYMSNLITTPGLSRHIREQSDIDKLLEAGYIDKEAGIRIRRRSMDGSATHSQPKTDAFRRGVHAPLPRIETPRKQSTTPARPSGQASIPVAEPTAPVSDADQIMWFQTGKMTGGSRNILDLSKTALVAKGSPKGTVFDHGEEGTMGGGTQFFGVDPADEDATKDICINFDGVDYVGNTIKYPTGEKANGTWRLQIKGESSAGEKITQVLGKGRLVGKVLAFTRVRDDYYFLSIFDGGDLEEFEGASRIVAYNGTTNRSRLMGLL